MDRRRRRPTRRGDRRAEEFRHPARVACPACGDGRRDPFCRRRRPRPAPFLPALPAQEAADLPLSGAREDLSRSVGRMHQSLSWHASAPSPHGSLASSLRRLPWYRLTAYLQRGVPSVLGEYRGRPSVTGSNSASRSCAVIADTNCAGRRVSATELRWGWRCMASSHLVAALHGASRVDALPTRTATHCPGAAPETRLPA